MFTNKNNTCIKVDLYWVYYFFYSIPTFTIDNMFFCYFKRLIFYYFKSFLREYNDFITWNTKRQKIIKTDMSHINYDILYCFVLYNQICLK